MCKVVAFGEKRKCLGYIEYKKKKKLLKHSVGAVYNYCKHQKSNTMSKFKINDKIQQMRYRTVIAKGTITAGPFNVEKVDHYHVQWEWSEDNNHKMYPVLICDMPTQKYHYRKQEGSN